MQSHDGLANIDHASSLIVKKTRGPDLVGLLWAWDISSFWPRGGLGSALPTIVGSWEVGVAPVDLDLGLGSALGSFDSSLALFDSPVCLGFHTSDGSLTGDELIDVKTMINRL